MHPPLGRAPPRWGAVRAALPVTHDAWRVSGTCSGCAVRALSARAVGSEPGREPMRQRSCAEVAFENDEVDAQQGSDGATVLQTSHTTRPVLDCKTLVVERRCDDDELD